MKINAITEDQVKFLKPEELVGLLDVLLSAEIEKYFTNRNVDRVSVPRPITIKDGGEDGRVELTVDDSNDITSLWIKSKFTCFQCKAQEMSEADCKKEVVVDIKKRKNREIKPQVKKCFDADGEYILITTDTFTDQATSARVTAIRNALKSTGLSKYADRKIKVYDSNQIAKWCNDHLAAITFVQKCRGIERLQPFLTWTEWHKTFLVDKKYEYQESEYLEACRENLYDLLQKEKVVRVVGHKGLGKTRFVLEAFNPARQVNEVTNLSQGLVYIDLASTDPTKLSGFLISYRDLDGLIIVDNCPDDWHNNYSAPVKSGGNLRLITINDSPLNSSSNLIYFNRREQKDVVRMIFQNCFQGLTDAQVDHLVSISEGFPEMVSYIDNVLRDKSADLIYNTIPSDFIYKFLFGGNKDEAEYHLFKACSIFTEFSFYDEKDDDILSIDEKKKITDQNTLIHSKISGKVVDDKAFYAFCVKYRDKRSLLEKRGLKYSVIPEPIAVNLAAEWWEENRFDFVKELMPELQQNSLLIPMMDRLSSLDQSERAKTIVAKAWGPNGPFTAAEVLNTELGSRLFRSVVEVNPIATTEGLETAFEDFSIEELKAALLAGRRNVVWALEKLVFRDETFDKSAKILARLAAGENENFGNNATGQFLQLFHIHLPGTSVNFERRLAIVNWMLEDEEPELHRLAVNAMSRGLKAHHFHRSIGAENQGFGTTIIEYRPDTWQEIFNYWAEMLNMLVNEVVSGSSYAELAKAEIAQAIRSLFGSGNSVMIKNAIERIFEVDDSLWNEAVDSLKITARYEDLNDSDKQLIEQLVSMLTPSSIADKIKFIVTTPAWEYNADDLDQQLSSRKAEQLAEELIAQEIDLITYLPLLLVGEQRQTYAFGAYFSEHYANVGSLIDESINQLSAIPQNTQNPTLLAGLISKLTAEDKYAIVDRLLQHPNLIRTAFYLTRLIEPSLADLRKLFKTLKSSQVSIDEFEGFQYGRGLDKLETSDVIKFCRELASYEIKGGWIAFLIISQYCYSDENKWAVCSNFTQEVLTQYNFLLEDHSYRHDVYRWSMFAAKLLNNTQNETFAQTVSDQIIKALSNSYFYASDRFMTDLVKILTEQYFKIFWNVMSPKIAQSGIEFLNLKELIGAKNGAFGSNGPFFEVNHEEIISWCKNTGSKAPLRIGYIMPVFQENGWHPFAKKMIDEFGKDEKFLNEVSANMGSYSMVGSSIPYYSRIIDLATQLFNHREKNVAKWAKKMAANYKKMIRREELEEEERR